MNKNDVLKWLEKTGSTRYKDGLARYGIVAPKAFGVPVGAMLKFAKQHGKDHALAAELWKSGWYEARLLAAMMDDPKKEYVKRASFAMMAGQAGHNKTAEDAEFLALLPIIEKGAQDERNFVKKAVNWALRRIGGRSPKLYDAAIATAKRLAASDVASCRWVGKDALRDLSRPLVRARAARKKD